MTRKPNKNIYDSLTSDATEKLARFADLLFEENQKYNLTAAKTKQQIIDRHFADSLAVLELLVEIEKQNPASGQAPEQTSGSAAETAGSLSLVDIATGAGLPGLVIAAVLPHWQILSIESTGKKAAFQQMVIDSLPLPNAKVLNVRAEKLAAFSEYREAFSAATARAAGPADIILELSAPFLKVGSPAILWKGPKYENEKQNLACACKKIGFNPPSEISYTLPTLPESSLRLIEVVKNAPTKSKYPRSFKTIKANPLGQL
jgi:16S rRNA (guanine527-N7)-methyltransferase